MSTYYDTRQQSDGLWYIVGSMDGENWYYVYEELFSFPTQPEARAWLIAEGYTNREMSNRIQKAVAGRTKTTMLRRIWQFLNRLFRRKTYRETIQAEKPVMFLPLDVKLYDRVLSADEIKAHYEQNEESGTVFHDLSGHGYDAELRSERQP